MRGASRGSGRGQIVRCERHLIAVEIPRPQPFLGRNVAATSEVFSAKFAPRGIFDSCGEQCGSVGLTWRRSGSPAEFLDDGPCMRPPLTSLFRLFKSP
jgi:hypothetical protein